MNLLIAEFSERIASAEFAQIERHPDFPQAFTRNSKLPLPALIGALLSMRNQSQQALLDGFFASGYTYRQRVRPRLVMCLGDALAEIKHAITMLGSNYQRFVPRRSQPRPPHHVKPHPSCSYKS